MEKAEENVRAHLADYIGKAEIVVYSVVAVLLFVTAMAASVSAGKLLWHDFSQHLVPFQTLAC